MRLPVPFVEKVLVRDSEYLPRTTVIVNRNACKEHQMSRRPMPIVLVETIVRGTIAIVVVTVLARAVVPLSSWISAGIKPGPATTAKSVPK